MFGSRGFLMLIMLYAVLSLSCFGLCPTPDQVAPLDAVVQQAGPRPGMFPGRIWAACDFEGNRERVAWAGQTVRDNIKVYPGNSRSLKAVPGSAEKGGILSVSPVYRPRMGKNNSVYFRYYLTGTDKIRLDLFNWTTGQVHRTVIEGLERNKWAEATADFSSAKSVNGALIAAGERMEQLLFAVGDGELLVDDVICFTNDPDAGGSPPDEPFPRRVIEVWGFDVMDDYHPWTHDHFMVVRSGGKLKNDWGSAKTLKQQNRDSKRVRLVIAPPLPVGDATRIRFRYDISGTDSLRVMIFDLTDADNRTNDLIVAGQDDWYWADLDLTRATKNDGNQTPFSAGNLVDDIFFLPAFGARSAVELFLDDVILYDAYREY